MLVIELATYTYLTYFDTKLNSRPKVKLTPFPIKYLQAQSDYEG